jgi:hypothetical protein
VKYFLPLFYKPTDEAIGSTGEAAGDFPGSSSAEQEFLLGLTRDQQFMVSCTPGFDIVPLPRAGNCLRLDIL